MHQLIFVFEVIEKTVSGKLLVLLQRACSIRHRSRVAVFSLYHLHTVQQFRSMSNVVTSSMRRLSALSIT